MVGKYKFYAENTNDGSSKFWAIQDTEVGMVVRVTWGKIGTTGQSQDFDADVAEKRKRDKLRKGYVEDAAKMKRLNEGVKEIEVKTKKAKEVEEIVERINFLDELGKI